VGPQGPQGETGATGATGEAGPAGPAGADGADGIDGADGNTILSGTSAPTNETGDVGDFFIATAFSQIYGPKVVPGLGWVQRGMANGDVPPPPPFDVQPNTYYYDKSNNDAYFFDGVTYTEITFTTTALQTPVYNGEEEGTFIVSTAFAPFFYALFQVATVSAWGNPTSIVGAPGQPGQPGTSVRNGVGAPTQFTFGSPGDFYLDTEATVLWGPKPSQPTVEWPAAGIATETVGTPEGGEPGDYAWDAQSGGVLYYNDGGIWVIINTVAGGSNNPTSFDGFDGAYWVNYGTLEVFGPRTSNYWGPSISLIGEGGGGSTDYTPANSLDWEQPGPTTFAQALDRLAAALVIHLGTQIPS
jgi:hypothetical protein